MKNIFNFNQFVNERFDSDDEPFKASGYYTVSNSGGYEVQISDDGDSASMKDSFSFTKDPKVSEWFEIEYVPDDDNLGGDVVPIIDPNGYNIPLNQVMRF